MNVTLRFLDEYRRTTTCSSCKRAPAEGRKTCPVHLERAKLQWRMWSARREKMGLCIACDRPGYKARGEKRECRCLLHKGANQAKCRAWVKNNADWCSFKSAFERLFLKLDRICLACRARPMAVGSVRHCVGCRVRHRQHQREYRVAA